MSMLKVSLSPHIHAPKTTKAIMSDVLIALFPAVLVAVFLNGIRAALIPAASIAAAMLSEWICEKILKRPVTVFDGSAAVTGLLLALSLPTAAPWWLPVVGSAFAIVLVKQFFGGLGFNFVNPALAARAFLLASWPALMTSYYMPLTDVVTSATPLSGGTFTTAQLFWGNIPGAYGEVCKLALLLGGVFLIVRGIIDWRIPLTYLASVALFGWVFGGDPLTSVLSGGVIMAGFFMLTDYVTSPATCWGRVLFAFGAGLITVLIRVFGNYPEGVTYAVLFMNVLSPLLEKFTRPRIYGEVKKHA